MADRNKEQADYNKQLREAQELIREINRLKAKLGESTIKLTDAEAVKSIQTLKREVLSLKDALGGLENSATGLYQELRSISSEILGQRDNVRKLKSAFNGLSDAARQLRDDELGILDLNKRQVQRLQEKVKINAELARDSAKGFEKQRAVYNEFLEYQKLQGQFTKDVTKMTEKQVNRLGNLEEKYGSVAEAQKAVGDAAFAAFKFAEDEENVANRIVTAAQARLKVEEGISKRMGVSGAIVEGIGGIMQRLGMRSGIFSDAMEEASAEMRRMAKDTETGAANFSKLQIAAKGFGTILKGIGPALMDPLVLVGSIVSGFFEANRATVEFQNLTGQSSVAIAGMNNRLASTVDYLEQAAALTKLTGYNANNVFSSRTIATAAELQNTMGLSADEAGRLGIISTTNTGYLDDQINAIVDTTSAFNKANRTAISQGQILRDVANTSDSIKLSLGNNPGLIAAAASAARRLGMELSEVDSIADSLMNFESSIQNELEAQLLTGKQLNLGKARELALNNDLVGLGNELFKNSVDINEYGKMNRIQQESYAKALGMTKDQLAKIAYQRAIETGLTAEQAAAAANVNAEDMKRMAVQDQIKKSLDKLSQAAAPVLEIIAGVVDVLTPFITTAAKGIAFLVRGFEGIGTKLSAVGKALTPIINTFINDIQPAAEAAVMYLVKGYRSLGSIGDLVSDGFAAVKDTVIGFAKPLKKVFSTIGDELKPIFTFIESRATKTKAIFQSIGNTIKAQFATIKTFFQPFTDGINRLLDKLKPVTDAFSKLSTSVAGLFGNVDKGEKSLAGIGSILGDLGKIAGVGIIASKVYKGIKARRAPKGTSSDPINVVMAGGGMASSITDMLGGKKGKGGIINKIKDAVLGKKFKGGQFMGKGLRAAAGGQRGAGMLSKLGGGLTKMGPKLLKGSGILSAIGVVTDLAGNISKASDNPEKGIGAALGRTLDQNKFMALGAAVGSIVPGVGTLIGAGIGGLVDFASSQILGEKGMITDSLDTTPPPQLATGGIVTKPTKAIVGEAGPEAVIPLREFYAKMDELINVVKQGGDVYIDGNKAGQSLMLASSKLS